MESSCNNDTYGIFLENTITQTQTNGDLGQDMVALSSTDNNNLGPKVTVPLFIFSYTLSFLWKDLPKELPICAPSVVFFKNDPYVLLPRKYVSQGLTYSPLAKKSKLPNQYFITVNAIQVGEKNVAIDSGKLKINNNGKGNAKLRIVVPYTTIVTSIYTVICDAFVKEVEAKNISRVATV